MPAPDDPARSKHHEALDELLREPGVRGLLVEVLAEEMSSRRKPSPWSRLQPWVAGAASALVTILVFFLPSLQDQWDRWHSRQVIQRYVEMGRGFMREGRYRLAEQSFARAFELSENQRLDIEEERLEARVEQVNADPEWGKENPAGLKESDFLYLIQLRAGPRRERQRAAALSSYGVFLAGEGRSDDAVRAFRDAIRLDSTNAVSFIGLGNALSDLGRAAEAEAAYRRGAGLDTLNSAAWYDLALLLRQTGRRAEAEVALRRAVAADSTDADALRELAAELDQAGKKSEAAAVRARLARLPATPPPPRDVPPSTEGEPPSPE